MKLRDALRQAEIISIGKEFSDVFSVDPDKGFQATSRSGQESFLTNDGLDHAHYNVNGFWETACGPITCYQLTNIALQ